MPWIHLGVYLTQDHETSQAVRWALEVRMFLISTARTYLTAAGRVSRVRGRTVVQALTAQLTVPRVGLILHKCITTRESLDRPLWRSYLVRRTARV